MGSPEIFIARHGQNEDNARGILNGRRDLPLTDLGREQAQQLAQSIDELSLSFDKIYSSPLSRASETAKIIADKIGLDEIEIMPNLIERDFGIMTGRPITDIEKLCAPRIIKSDPIIYFLDPEGAETFPDLLKRSKLILDEVRNNNVENESVLLVCHGDIGKMIYAAATDLPWKEVLVNFHFGNCDLIDVSDKVAAKKISLEQVNS